jgi:hypothetical protein
MLPSTQKRERERGLQDFQITLGSLQLLLGYIIIPVSCYPLCTKGVHIWVEKYCYSINDNGN